MQLMYFIPERRQNESWCDKITPRIQDWALEKP